MIDTISIAPLAGAAEAAIEALLDRAFGADRHTRTAYRLREGATAIPSLSFAARQGDVLAGTLQCWPVALEQEPMVMVGPVAIEPALQNRGIGRAMMAAMLAAADAGAVPHADALMMVGDPEYYARFGFTAQPTSDWRMPGPWESHRLLARLSSERARGLNGMLAPR